MSSSKDPVAPADTVSIAADKPPVVDHTLMQSVTRAGPKTYVVQLALSVVAFDPRNVPRLDIFDLYHLYCDISVEDGLMRNALRLGFFRDAHTAKAVAHYLGSFFDSPRVVHIDAAEEARSTQHKLVALKDVGAAAQRLDVELVAPRPLPVERRGWPARLKPRRPKPQDAAPSLWSRLLGHAR
jgi:hypothetical protein